MPDGLRARRTARLAREHKLNAQRFEPLRKQPRMGRLAASLAAFKCDEAPTHASALAYSRCRPARKKPRTISVAASKARRDREPTGMDSAACKGTSSTKNSPRQTFKVPIFCPCCTGAGMGPE